MELIEKFRLEDPVDQIIFILEVIIEALAIHVTGIADIANGNFAQRALAHQILHGIGQDLLGDT